jgi:hypothetical protein
LIFFLKVIRVILMNSPPCCVCLCACMYSPIFSFRTSWMIFKKLCVTAQPHIYTFLRSTTWWTQPIEMGTTLVTCPEGLEMMSVNRTLEKGAACIKLYPTRLGI